MDYKDAAGEDFNRDLTVWHCPGASDRALVEDVREQVRRQVNTMTALWELPGPRPLWISKAWFD